MFIISSDYDFKFNIYTCANREVVLVVIAQAMPTKRLLSRFKIHIFFLYALKLRNNNDEFSVILKCDKNAASVTFARLLLMHVD